MVLSYEEFKEEHGYMIMAEWNEHDHCAPVYELDQVPEEEFKSAYQEYLDEFCTHEKIEVIKDDPSCGGMDTFHCPTCNNVV